MSREGILNQLQSDLFLILQEFNRVCLKNDVDYILSFGTALGALRHGGFIPWDDDIDVCISQRVYEKLMDALDNDLNDQFYYQCFEKDNRYNIALPTMKIRMRNREMKERFGSVPNNMDCCDLFLDVFVMDKASANPTVHLAHKALSKVLGNTINVFEYIGINPLPFKRGMVRYSAWYAQRYQDSEYIDLTLRWPHEPLKYRGLREDEVFPPRYLEFNGEAYPVAQDIERYLTVCYGPDYMIPPNCFNQVPKHFRIEKSEKKT